MSRIALVASSLLAAAAAGGPLAEVWPYQAKRLDVATWEYAYDLTALKASGGNPDAKGENGEEAVAAFLKGLPAEVKLKVKVGAPMLVSGARGLEVAPLATSFATVSDAPLASDDPLRRKPKGRVRPALDPDEPKLLPAAEMVLWRVRRTEDAALASATLDSDRIARVWIKAVYDKAVARIASTDGDARDGAIVLSARLAVALACLEQKAVQVRPEAATEAKAQVAEMRNDPDALTPLGFHAWSSELQCAWRRSWALGRNFQPSRGGYAAPLVFASILKDAKLKATWLKLRGRRDAWYGGPPQEPLQQYLEKAGADPDAALDDLMTAIDRQGGPPPPLLARSRTPFGELLGSLRDAERQSPLAELLAAAADGRVRLPNETTAPVELQREAALAALVASEPPTGLQYDAAWRDRFASAFGALQGAHHELRENNLEPSQSDVLRNELKVVLEVPPVLDVEPAPLVYRKASDSMARLAAALKAEGLGGLRGIDPEGAAVDGVVAELERWQSVLAGLSVLSTPAPAETPDVARAKAFIAAWRNDPTLARDVRFAAASPVSFEGARPHAVIQGVARRELAVAFLEPPAVEAPKGFTVDLKAEQRYLVPVLLTAGYRAKAVQAPLPFKDVRRAIDNAGRLATQIPAALAELKKP